MYFSRALDPCMRKGGAVLFKVQARLDESVWHWMEDVCASMCLCAISHFIGGSSQERPYGSVVGGSTDYPGPSVGLGWHAAADFQAWLV